MSTRPFEDAYDTIGSLGAMICALGEATCSLSKVTEFNLAGDPLPQLTPEQIGRNLDFDALTLAFLLVRTGIRVPYKAGRREEAFPFAIAVWALNIISLLRSGVSLANRVNVPGGNMVVGKVTGAVELVESVTRLVLQGIVAGFNLDVSDVEDEEEKTKIIAGEILRLSALAFAAIGGSCNGASQFVPDPVTKGKMRLVGAGSKGLFALLTGAEVYLDRIDDLVAFAQNPGDAFKKFLDSPPWIG